MAKTKKAGNGLKGADSPLAVPDALKVANGGTNKPFKSGKSRGRPKGSKAAKPGEDLYKVTGSKSRPAKK